MLVTGMYKISFDPVSRVLLIKAQGFLRLPVVAAFAVELLARIAAIRVRHGRFVALVDLTEVPVQRREVIDAIEKVMAKALTIVVVPTAALVSSHLGKLQAERCFKAGHCRAFLDIDEAKAWLEAEREPAARAA